MTSPLADLAARMESAGANLIVTTPDGDTLTVGPDPTRARVTLKTSGAVSALARGDHLALA